MAGLIVKDFKSLKQYAKSLLFVLLVWTVMGVLNKSIDFIGGALMIFIPMVSMSAVAYDEKVKWDRYALTMPISRSDLVLSKYALGIIVGVGCSVYFAVLSLMVSGEMGNIMEKTMIYYCLGILIMAVQMPPIFRLGTERARVVCMLIYLLPFAVIFLLSKLGTKIPLESLKALEKYLWLAPIAVLIILVLSALISINICKKKEY